MTTVKELDEGLAELKSLADTHEKLYVSSKIALYQTLVETYLWWRKASQKDGYLDKRFEEENIGYRSNLNRPNFAPVVRLVMRIPSHKRVLIRSYGFAINAIDDEYIRNGHIYTNRDASAELVDWIDDSGGIAGITGSKVEELEIDGYDYKGAGKPKAKKKKESEDKKQAQLDVLRLKKTAIAQNATAQTIDIGAVGTGDDDLVVVLAKATGNGNELRVIGTTAQQGLVDGAVMNIGDIDFVNTPTTLRMLCEAIKINTIPKALQNYGARGNFYNKTKLEKQNTEGKMEKVRENARLVLQRNGTILVSKSSSEASLTTYYIPSKKFELDEDIWLRGSDRYWLETELINESEIALYDATDLEKQKNKKIKAVKQVTLKNTLNKQKRNLYFYDYSKIDDEFSFQPALVKDDIQYDWAVKGNASYFRRLYEQHFDGWQHRVKHRVHTANNKAVAFDVSEDGIVCEKKWDKADACFTQTGARYLTAFGDDAETCGTGRIVFAPTDIIAVLQMLSQHSVKDDLVMMSGNEDLLFINYKNDLAEVQIYIPSCSITGKRNSKYFTKFVAND